MTPNLSLNPDAPRRACGPSFVAPVSLVRWASCCLTGEERNLEYSSEIKL